MAISYKSDGFTLVDGAGNTSTPMDGTKYSDMLTIMDEQVAAVSANTAAVADYNTKLANAQVNVTAGRTVPVPIKPLQSVVSDTGVTTQVPFNPPLADIVPLAPVEGGTTGGPPKQVTPDTQAIMYAMITAIYRKLFPTA